jgi:hypothetical protein
MKKILVFVLVVVTSGRVTYADSWAKPVEQLYLSQNKQFVAQVTPAKDGSPATLKVFLVRGQEGWISWQCTLGNEGAPQEVFVTDDGRYVATVNENSSRVHGGMGDYVVAFYKKDRLIKNYSLEQILHYPEQIDEREFQRLGQRSVSGRSWVSMPMLLDEYGGKLYFCVWLFRGERWLAWEVATGEEVEINENMVKRWDEKGRLWALEHGIQSNYWVSAAQFLGKHKKEEDRKAIESLLTDDSFYTQPVSKWRGEFIRYNASSPRRSLAESILAEWDGRAATEPASHDQKYYYLGVVEGKVVLPEAPKAGDHWLCVYLIPAEVGEENWWAEVPVYRITGYFWEYSFSNSQWPGSSIPFRIQGVTPGEYWLNAVWDKAQPYTFEDNYIKGPPQDGDFQSTDAPIITVKAGETIDNVIIDCTHKIGGETN